MRINHNIAALNTYNRLAANQVNGSKSLEKLSSGLRINRAGDDAAGLAISEKMRGQIRGLDQASRNAQDGISMIQTAEGALSETHSMLQRMRELSVQASNTTMETADKTAIGEEMKELATEINRIAEKTTFNGQYLLNGSLQNAVDATSGTKDGATVSTGLTGGSTLTVSNVDVSGAQSGTTYTISAGTAAGDLKLTANINGNTVSKEFSLAAMTATPGESQVVDFSSMGIKFTLTTDGTGAETAADIASATITDLGNVITSATNSAATFAIGANTGETMDLSFGDMRASVLGDESTSNDLATLVMNANADSIVDTTAKAQNLITQLDTAINEVSTQRGKFGAAQNRLEHTINNLNTASENMTAAESRIRDVDMAKEMMEFTKTNILSQAATAMMAQANQSPQGVLQLLR